MGGQGWQPLEAKSMCAMCEFMAIFSPYFFLRLPANVRRGIGEYKRGRRCRRWANNENKPHLCAYAAKISEDLLGVRVAVEVEVVATVATFTYCPRALGLFISILVFRAQVGGYGLSAVLFLSAALPRVSRVVVAVVVVGLPVCI